MNITNLLGIALPLLDNSVLNAQLVLCLYAFDALAAVSEKVSVISRAQQVDEVFEHTLRMRFVLDPA